jgi:hypothetical protein
MIDVFFRYKETRDYMSERDLKIRSLAEDTRVTKSENISLEHFIL